MSSIRSRDAIQESFLRKGFQEKQGGDHWRYIYFSCGGQKTAVHTKLSRGSKYKYPSDALIAQMAKQCRLAKGDFLALVDCPLSREGYEEKLRVQGAI